MESSLQLPAAWYNRDWILAVLLLLTVLLAYQPVTHAGWVWDDNDHVTENPTVVGPLGLKEIWTTSAGDISPLTRSTFWLEHKLWGLSPAPYHIVNVIFQAACGIFLWQVLRKLRVPGAWLGAAIWALHPIQVESVAWVSELKNTESGLFFLLSVFFFIENIRHEDVSGSPKLRFGWHYYLSLLFALLAMASKVSTVVLPACLCLCAWWIEGRWQWRNLLRVAPMVLMTALASIAVIWSQGKREAMSHDHPLATGTLPERIVRSANAIWFYLGKLAWPHPLMAMYPDPKIVFTQWFSYLPLVILLGALVVLWLRPRSWMRPYFFVLAWFLVALTPALPLFDPYTSRYSAAYSWVYLHFQYLAGMAPLALLGAGLMRLTSLPNLQRPWLRPLIAVTVLTILGVSTWHRAWAYESQEALWTDTVAKNPGSWTGHQILGLESARKGQVDQAIAHFREVIAINPDFADAHNDLGVALAKKGRTDEALAEYTTALKISANYAEAHYNFGNLLLQSNQLDPAISHFRKALELNPAYIDATNNLGIALGREGHFDEAIEQYQKALSIDPDNVSVHFNLGDALAQMGRSDDALPHLRRVLEMHPDYADAHNDLGIVLARKGQMEEALREFREALRLDPGQRGALDNMEKLKAFMKQSHRSI